ncbi:MAG: hypothetical protein ACI35S_01125 [Anaeroplasma sp.]
MNYKYKNIIRDNEMLLLLCDELCKFDEKLSDDLISLIAEKKKVENEIYNILINIENKDLIDLATNALKKNEDIELFSSQKESISYLLEILNDNFSKEYF